MGMGTFRSLEGKPVNMLGGFQNVWSACRVDMDILVELLCGDVGYSEIILRLGMTCMACGGRERI